MAYYPNYYYNQQYYKYYYPNSYQLQMQPQVTGIENSHYGQPCCHKPTCPNRHTCSFCNQNSINSDDSKLSSKVSIKNEVYKSFKQAITESILSTLSSSKKESLNDNSNKLNDTEHVYEKMISKKKSSDSLNSLSKNDNIPPEAFNVEYYYNNKGQKVLRYYIRDADLPKKNQSLNNKDYQPTSKILTNDYSKDYKFKPSKPESDDFINNRSFSSKIKSQDDKFNETAFTPEFNRTKSKNLINQKAKLSESTQSLNRLVDRDHKSQTFEYIYQNDNNNSRYISNDGSSGSLSAFPTTSSNSPFKNYFHSRSTNDLDNFSKQSSSNELPNERNMSLKSILKNTPKKVEFNDYPSIRTIKKDRSISQEDFNTISKSSADSTRFISELIIEPKKTRPAELIINSSKLTDSKTSSRSSSLSRRSRSTDDLFDYDGVPLAPTPKIILSNKSESYNSRSYTPNPSYSTSKYSYPLNRDSKETNNSKYDPIQSYQMQSDNNKNLYPDLQFSSKPLYRTLNLGQDDSNHQPQEAENNDNSKNKLIDGIRQVILSPNKDEVQKNLNKGIRFVAKKFLKQN